MTFAEGCGFYKVVMCFYIAAFLGDIIEMVFCRVTEGVWMSRSSVVWGPFSIVWGLAIALGTVMLYRYRNQGSVRLFLAGTVLGGLYEYLCSVFTEVLYGKVFWDYSNIPLNVNGRINLWYCFFWGVAAVLWLKKLYPVISSWIEKIPKKTGTVIIWCLIVFMCINIGISSMVLWRFTEREDKIPADGYLEQWVDTHYGDEIVHRIYPNVLDR